MFCVSYTCILLYYIVYNVISYIRYTYHMNIQWFVFLDMDGMWLRIGFSWVPLCLCHFYAMEYVSYAMPLLLRCLWISLYVIDYILYAVSHICYFYLNRVCPIFYAIHCISCHELHVSIPVFLPGLVPSPLALPYVHCRGFQLLQMLPRGFPSEGSD